MKWHEYVRACTGGLAFDWLGLASKGAKLRFDSLGSPAQLDLNKKGVPTDGLR